VARNTWTVDRRGAQALLRSDAHVEVKGGPVGWLVRSIARRQAGRTGRQALGAFKYLVETGQAPGDLSKRLPVPATC